MALSLLKYAEHLDERGDPKPAGPDPVPFASAKPHVPALGAKAVVCAGWGTLWLSGVAVPELVPADPIMRKIAFDKTVSEFKMWHSMSRKPGEPGELMAATVEDVRQRLLARTLGAGGRELPFGAVWRGVLDRLLQKEYAYDAGFYGDLDAYAEKIALYCQRAAAGLAALPDALATLRALAARGIKTGLHANGQAATPILLQRALAEQGRVEGLHEAFAPGLCVWSHEIGGPIESERGWSALESALASGALRPEETVYVGNDLERDVLPARRRGFRTALLVADRGTAKVRPAQLKDEKTKPDALLTAFGQIARLCAA
jgi:FMN phosphatase YigB (HAD superfamily)